MAYKRGSITPPLDFFNNVIILSHEDNKNNVHNIIDGYDFARGFLLGDKRTFGHKRM